MSTDTTRLTPEQQAEIFQKLTPEQQKQVMAMKAIELSREHLISFAMLSMKNYKPNWHHKLIAYKLEQLERGEIRRLIITLPPRHGKACSDSTPVFTTKGWKKHGDLSIGDKVFDINRKPVEIIATSEKFNTDYVVFCSNGERIRCHENHEWLVCVKDGWKFWWEQLETHEIFALLSIGVEISLPDENGTRITRIKVDANGEQGYCIQVDSQDGIYLVGKTMIPTHNSELVSKRFPAWYLGRNPHKRFIAASYSATLAERFGKQTRDLIDSSSFKAVFPEVILKKGSQASDQWDLSIMNGNDIIDGGGYICAGVGGSITGFGGDMISIDDPFKDRKEADSATIRESVKDWYTSTLYTRLEAAGGIVLTHTRWHEDDLAGYLINEEKIGGEKWDILNLPAIAEENEPYRKIGEPLWADKYDLEQLELIQRAIGSRDWNSLYQQRPSSAEGDIFKREWWKFYDILPQKFDKVFQSWDMTFKDTKTSDYVVGQVWGIKDANWYLIDQVRDRMDFVKTCQAVEEMSSKYPEATAKFVEDKANGSAVISSLKDKIRGIIPVNPNGGKESRAFSVQPYVQAGNVWLPNKKRYSWVDGFIEECASFPKGKHDDQVDAMTQALSNTAQAKTNKIIAFKPKFKGA